jgi:hypothetical protein
MSPMLPPTLPLKDALRGLRSGLQFGRSAIAPLRDDAPQPVRDLVGEVFTRLDRIGLRLEQAGSALAHTLLDATPQTAPGLAALAAHPEGAALFAQQLYLRLGAAAQALGGDSLTVSEFLAAQAFEQATAARPAAADDADLAALLFLRLEALLPTAALPFAPRTPADLRRLALFAVLLWLIAPRDAANQAAAGEEAALFGVACDAAAALGRETADLPADRAGLRRLLADYAAVI